MTKYRIIQATLIALVSLLVIFGVFYLLKINGAFQLRAIQISGNHYVTKQDIAGLIDIDFSKDLFQIDTDSLCRSLSRHPMVQKVEVSKSYPSVLKIKIKEHELVAGVAGSEIVAASREKTLIYDYPAEVLYDLPVITGIHFKRDEYGNRVPENEEMLKFCIALLERIKTKDPILYSDISELHYDRNAGISFFLKNNNLPVLIGKGKIADKLNAFSSFYHRKLHRLKTKEILVVDARFQSQVIVKKKT